MTQEQKAKRYDEAIARAKAILKVTDNMRESLLYVSTIFPELKESEDEKIRNWLIGYFHQYKEDGMEKYANGLKVESIIAWLENQGEQKPALLFNNESRYHLWTIQDAKDGDVLNSPTHNLIWIYKDNEHYHACVNMNYVTENVATDGLISIPNDACPATKDEQTILFTKMHEAGYEWDAEKKELKKVEPKFHEGDWVVCEVTGSVYQIKNYIENLSNHKYGYDLTNGGYIGSDEVNHYRLWTIQDAKDGDVLCTYECNEPKIVFILKGTPKKHYALSYYCYYNIMYPHFASDSKKGCLAPINEDVKPATKEQRDLLFQKMKEA